MDRLLHKLLTTFFWWWVFYQLYWRPYLMVVSARWRGRRARV